MGEVTGLPWKGRAYLRSKYPGVFPLSESQFDILKGIAKAKNPTNAYRLAKSIGRAYSNVYTSLKELERRRLVMFKGEEKTEKHTTAKNYDLTLESILILLQKEMEVPEKRDLGFIRRIMEKYSTLLPLVFGKWNYFENSNAMVKKLAGFRLKVLVDRFGQDSQAFRKGLSYIGSPEMELEQKISWFFYFQFNHFKYSEPWLNALRQDDEIRAFALKELKAHQKKLMNRHSLIENTISSIAMYDGKSEMNE